MFRHLNAPRHITAVRRIQGFFSISNFLNTVQRCDENVNGLLTNQIDCDHTSVQSQTHKTPQSHPTQHSMLVGAVTLGACLSLHITLKCKISLILISFTDVYKNPEVTPSLTSGKATIFQKASHFKFEHNFFFLFLFLKLRLDLELKLLEFT